jgi:hypothetical protein
MVCAHFSGSLSHGTRVSSEGCGNKGTIDGNPPGIVREIECPDWIDGTSETTASSAN